MSGLNLRPLLPAPRGPSTIANNKTITPDHNPAHRQNSGACDGCRSQKSRCDRARPKCRLRVKRQVTCFYGADVKKQSLKVRKYQNELLHIMQTAPEDEAINILFRLRAAGNPQAVLESSRSNMSRQYQLSDIATARAVSTSAFSGVEFELSMRCPLPYPQVPAANTGSIDPKPLASLRSGGHASGGSGGGGASGSISPMTFDSQRSYSSSMPEDSWDERLRYLDISYWTTVVVPSNVAAKIISNYLQTHHSIWELFSAELFVRDLVERRLEFCSPFLVNALLCYACQLYRVTNPNLLALSVPFAQATEVFWRAERSTDSVLNIAAIITFSLCCYTTNCGMSVAELMTDGIQMAERLQLLGRQDSSVL